jgi:hypothetical protein
VPEKPLAHELEVPVDLLRVIAAAHTTKRSLDHEHRQRFAATRHAPAFPSGARSSSKHA